MKPGVRRALLLAMLLAAAPAAQQPPAQTPPPTFRVEINYVEVDAIVTDAAGKPVAGLTAGDFEVLEDGAPQKVATFTVVDIPFERPDQPLFASEPIERDVQSNHRVDGRVYLIVLDHLHVHPLRTTRVRAAVRRFIEQHFGANDVAAVVFTSGRADLGQEFTNNRRLLLAAVDRFSGQRMRPSTLERLDEYNRTRDIRGRGERVADPTSMERAYKARAALDSIGQLAGVMAGIRGRRKAMLLISEGIDYDIHDVFSNQDASSVIRATRDAIGAATRANVSIYSIDPRGLTTLGEDGIEVGSFPFDEPAAGISPTDMQNELRRSQDSLRVIAEQTGGFAAVNQNDFAGAFERVVRENSTYYLLGYYPTNDRRDGRYRKIEVRVRRPGVQVRSRKGYQAPRGRAPEERRAGDLSATMRDAVGSPLPIAGVPMSMFAAPFKGAAPNAALAVVLELQTGDFTFVEKGGAFANDIEVLFRAADATGKMHDGERNTINLTLKPETLARIKARGFRIVSKMDLPPGRYQLRAILAESGGKSGSVHYDVEVPDFQKAPLSMSGIAITTTSAGHTPTARSDDPLRELLPGPPTTAREFARADEIALYAEIYENAPGSAPHGVDVVTTLRSEDGRVVLQSQEERSSTELQGGRGGYGYAMRIPLAQFAPGAYVLHVEAKSRTAPDHVVVRDLLIRVR